MILFISIENCNNRVRVVKNSLENFVNIIKILCKVIV